MEGNKASESSATVYKEYNMKAFLKFSLVLASLLTLAVGCLMISSFILGLGCAGITFAALIV
jgi:hypothetical protein